MNETFWHGKRVFITGHTGFKGSWLSLWLQDMGADVKGFSLAPPTEPSLFSEANIEDGMTSQIGDIRDYPRLLESIVSFKPEVVFHLAAQPLVRLSYRSPLETYSTNVIGTANLLEAVRECGNVRAVVNITSDKCYENREWFWPYRESEPMGGHDPYSSSKGCAELVTAAYRRSYFVDSGVGLGSARAGNVIGGGDWAEDRLVPDVLRSLAEHRIVKIRNPDAVRPWQHVLEPIAGYLQLANCLWHEPQKFAGGWNFGPREEDARPVRWVVEYLCEVWAENSVWEIDYAGGPHEARFLMLDTSKAKHELGWKPVWSLEEALTRVVEWQKQWLHKGNVRQACLKQIRDYSEVLEWRP